jgi:hypothetical protein
MNRSVPFDPEHDKPPGGTTGGNTIRLTVDRRAVAFHIDAAPGYRPSELASVLSRARVLGLEALDPQEYEAETLPDGSIRIWLAEIARNARSPDQADAR